MKRVGNVLLAILAVASLVSLTQPVLSAAPPSDRIVVMYFHRVPGCPACQKMNAYSEETVKSAFAKDFKEGKVEFHAIDFEDPKNAALTQGYKVTSPTLIVAKVAGNKVADYKNLTEIWAKVGDKKAFLDYVQAGIKDYKK